MTSTSLLSVYNIHETLGRAILVAFLSLVVENFNVNIFLIIKVYMTIMKNANNIEIYVRKQNCPVIESLEKTIL